MLLNSLEFRETITYPIWRDAEEEVRQYCFKHQIGVSFQKKRKGLKYILYITLSNISYSKINEVQFALRNIKIKYENPKVVVKTGTEVNK